MKATLGVFNMFVNLKIENVQDIDFEDRDIQIEYSGMEISKNGKSSRILFNMPNSKNYLYCFIFDISEQEYNNGITLEELIETKKDADIIDRRTPHDHYIDLAREGKRCVLYLARRDIRDNTYYLIDQNQGNISESIKVLPTIRCFLRYEPVKKGLFLRPSSQMKKVWIKITGDIPMPGLYITYCCKGKGREKIRFGIDISAFWNQEAEILIQKDELVEILPPADGTYLLQIL